MDVPETKIWMCGGQVTLSKINNFFSPFCNPNPDVHNINAHTKFGENSLTCTQVVILKPKYGHMEDR